VFGTLINFLGLRKVNTLGQKGAHKCMLIAATAFNLKKLLKFARKPIKTIAKHLKIPPLRRKVLKADLSVYMDFFTSHLRSLNLIFQ
jgi:hypothetical protein